MPMPRLPPPPLLRGEVIWASEDAMTFCGSSSLTRTSRLVMELDLQSERSGEAPSQSGNRGEAEVVAQVQRARPEVKNGYKMRNRRLGTVKERKMKKRL